MLCRAGMIRRLARNLTRSGFTLIEMIGVLAVIAILASLLVPKIFEAIYGSRVSHALLSYNTIKTALADHYAKFGILNCSNNVVLSGSSLTNYDKILLAEGFLDKPFLAKLGGGASWVQAVLPANFDANTAVSTDGAFDLDGDGKNDILGSPYVVEAVIPAVTELDARVLSDRLDGP